MTTRVKLETWALSLLVVTVLVILWGAYVRVTGSGAGCADHWPLCNGELVPRPQSIETVIELTHRVTSGLCGLLSIVVTVVAFRTTPRGSNVRRAAAVAFALMLLEGAIGALLVKRGLVAKNASEARAFVVGLHLVNTFLLLGAQLFTWHFARGGRALSLRAQPGRALLLFALMMLLLLLGASGAVTALGDTLFPAESLRAGFEQDLSPQAHFLVRLRVWHPLLAVLTGGLVVYVAQALRGSVDAPDVARWAWVLTFLYVAQVAVGSLNLLLLAPAFIQIVHLLLADLLWLALLMLAAATLVEREPTFSPGAVPARG